jgi:arylformamidase
MNCDVFYARVGCSVSPGGLAAWLLGLASPFQLAGRQTSKMEWIDLTMPISPEMIIWPGDPKPIFQIHSETCQTSTISIGSHTGTHIDAPIHFIPNAQGVESIPLNVLCGETLIIQVTSKGHVSREDLHEILKNIVQPVERILIKTSNSSGHFPSDAFESFVALSPSAAQYLLEKQVKLIGIDAPSIESFHASQTTAAVHKLLLNHRVVIVENVQLQHISADTPIFVEMMCLPLRIDSDGAPVRIVIRNKN